VKSVRRLTQAAKDKIAKDLRERGSKDVENKVTEECVDPPFMPPSPDPSQYSHVRLSKSSTRCALTPPKWCSYCHDFGAELVLCAGCRVCVCITTSTSKIACLLWAECVEDPDFIFHCHFCCARMKTACKVHITMDQGAAASDPLC